MQQSRIFDNVIAYSSKFETVITLLVDDKTGVAIAEKPIFGSEVTINDALFDHAGSILAAGTELGWVDYIDVHKFACITEHGHYLDAGQFFSTTGNTLTLEHPALLINIFSNMGKDKKILTLRLHIDEAVEEAI
ncbi:hypothetical protein [Agaribacter marinus]|uniref:Uncharacterized protein n=1 Tax=Agaribacter marinus TaxID=1431249 RepID=A0AA37SXZ2_9ALTE|nr:hypothetical protein [Agaribacter marinus]GLR69761.1 hypothetical protein GCM10007852_06690 [Agaribacter marinus]